MSYTPVSRDLLKHFLNTNPASPTYSLMGPGIASMEVNANPQTEDEIEIHQKQAQTYIQGYKMNIPVEQTVKVGEPIFNYINGLWKARAILSAAETDVVAVELYNPLAYGNYYPAEQQPVAIQVDKAPGGDGGKRLMHGFTMNGNGNPVQGWFDLGNLAFASAPVNAGLTSLVLASITLSPVFASGKVFYSASTSASTAAITAVSTNPAAVIVIKNGVTTVTNGGTATWVTGLNTVTVTVTFDGETVIYTVLVTKS